MFILSYFLASIGFIWSTVMFSFCISTVTVMLLSENLGYVTGICLFCGYVLKVWFICSWSLFIVGVYVLLSIFNVTLLLFSSIIGSVSVFSTSFLICVIVVMLFSFSIAILSCEM